MYIQFKKDWHAVIAGLIVFLFILIVRPKCWISNGDQSAVAEKLREIGRTGGTTPAEREVAEIVKHGFYRNAYLPLNYKDKMYWQYNISEVKSPIEEPCMVITPSPELRIIGVYPQGCQDDKSKKLIDSEGTSSSS